MLQDPSYASPDPARSRHIPVDQADLEAQVVLEAPVDQEDRVVLE